MRIVHINGHSGLNGVSKTLKMLVEAQAARGDEILLVHRPGAWLARQPQPQSVTLLESGQTRKRGEISTALRAMAAWSPDVVHAHGHKANRLAALGRILHGMPSVMTAHSRQPQLTWPVAHEVIAVNDPTRNFYLSRWLVSKAHIRTIPNLIDVSHLGPQPNEDSAVLRASVGVRPNSFVIGYVGSVDVRKQQTDLVRVLKRLVALGIDAEALIVGDIAKGKSGLPSLQAEMADPAIARRVHLTGQHPDAYGLMRAMDLMICTSHNEEGPLAPIEAMAQGVPVLSTRVGYMERVLPPERVFALGDVEGMARAAAALAADRPALDAIAARDLTTAHDIFRPDSVLPQIDAVYAAAIERAPRWARQRAK